MPFQISGLVPRFFDANPSSQIWNSHFQLQQQSNYLIYAPSGKGKSSFFKMLCGISKDYSGEIIFDDKSLKSSGPEELATFRSENWSLVFQNLALFPELSIKENLNISGEFEDCRESLELLGIDKKENQKANQLSYGERQRLAIIRALNKKYDFLIMDEPFSHLDNQLKTTAMKMIEKDALSKNASIIIFDLENEPLYDNFQKLLL